MRPYEFETFSQAIQQAGYQLQFRSKVVHTDHWQGTNIAARPEMATHELTHCTFAVPMRGITDLNVYREDIGPNLPWADDHFEERVCGEPLNPGVQWAKWPYGHSADKFRDANGQFNHNYMERYWPKFAGRTDRGEFSGTLFDPAYVAEYPGRQRMAEEHCKPRRGIRYAYGDARDVANLLGRDPLTRQAYLPIWFPEDTGGGDKRAPCTIGYHFLMRDGGLDVHYHIRSCDFRRHFRDDIYLTVRLVLWMIAEAAKVDTRWNDIKPGKFVMSIGSLHLFRNDYHELFKSQRPEAAE